MSFWTFVLLLVVLGWIGAIHLLNSESKAGKLARAFIGGAIEKLVGSNRPKDD